MPSTYREPSERTDENRVMELQGVEGPFSFPEKLLQKIWWRREFDLRGAITSDGRRVSILFPGKWNLLGGPDFRAARLLIDGGLVEGEVEVHLRVGDWVAHGHARDPAYAGVVLHVVLFPSPEAATVGHAGRRIPILALLPLLFHDLEEYAAEAAVAALANRPSVRIIEQLGGLTAEARVRLLADHAQVRWQQKVRFARVRLDRLGWEQACHHAAMEILGYRYNRVPMLRLAARHPLVHWTDGAIDPEAAFADEGAGWSLQGVRPANHPRRRLQQYAAWSHAVPDWPKRLARWAAALPVLAHSPGVGPTEVRRAAGFAARREGLSATAFAQTVGGTRLDNLVCDGFLPLAAAAEELPMTSGFDWWWHWFPGDLPAYLSRGLRDLSVIGERRTPLSHGVAQGLLGWLLAQESPV